MSPITRTLGVALISAVALSGAAHADGFKLCGQVANVNDQIRDCVVTKNAHQFSTLKDMKKLRKMTITAKAYRLDDKGAAYFGQAPNLEKTFKYFAVHHDNLTAEGIKSFEGLQALEEVYFYKSSLPDEGMKSIAKLKNLEKFGHSAPKNFDGSGLVHLKALPKLKKLNLSYSSIPLENLKVLAEYPALEVLDLNKTDHTQEDLEFLLMVNPDMRILTDH